MTESRRRRFTEAMASDEKRLCRGEQYLRARALLRGRDMVHHRAWRVLMLAGGSPRAECTTIRTLMPKAYITAVDNNPICVEAARDAGADEAVLCDLTDYDIDEVRQTYPKTPWRPEGSVSITRKTYPVKLLRMRDRYDVVHLDFCNTITPTLVKVTSVYRHLVSAGGVYIIAFSYGRDVVEGFQAHVRREGAHPLLAGLELPDLVRARIQYLCPWGLVDRLHSVVLYRGHEMPMCSLLFCVGQGQACIADRVSVVTIGPGDFELAVTHPDPALVYDCPQERIEALRRSHASIKASYTRVASRQAELPMG